MISSKRSGMLGRWLWPIALIGAMLAVAAAGPSVTVAASAQQGTARAAQQTQPAIDAQTDPDAAGAALDAATCGNCITWQTDTAPGGCANAEPAPAQPVQQAPCVPAANNQAHYAITAGWGTPAVFGDILFNCSADQPAETDTGVSDARSESFSLSEKVSLKIAVKIPDIASVSAEVSAFSTQATSSANTVSVQNGVTVPPGYKGWTTTQVKTETIPGSASVTDPIRNTATAIHNLDVSFPGYKLDPREAETSFTGHAVAMTDTETKTICGVDPVDNALRGFRVVGEGLTVRRPSRVALRVCGRTGPCRSRVATGSVPPARIRRATAVLTRAGHVYGRGTYARGRTQVHVNRALRPGAYRLTLREPSRRVGATLHATETTLRVNVS